MKEIENHYEKITVFKDSFKFLSQKIQQQQQQQPTQIIIKIKASNCEFEIESNLISHAHMSVLWV
jgi:hypothetical protein